MLITTVRREVETKRAQPGVCHVLQQSSGSSGEGDEGSWDMQGKYEDITHPCVDFETNDRL